MIQATPKRKTNPIWAGGPGLEICDWGFGAVGAGDGRQDVGGRLRQTNPIGLGSAGGAGWNREILSTKLETRNKLEMRMIQTTRNAKHTQCATG